MARAGKASEIAAGSDRSNATREALVGAAIATLKDVGFAGASAREIAKRAGCNQALVFYHYGSVVNLLLAALDEVSRQRLERYRPLVAGATSLTELVNTAATIFREDLEGGHMKVLAELIAGTSSTPGLATEVALRIEPWRAFARDAIGQGLRSTPLAQVIDIDAVAHAVVALYLGLEMLAQLDGDPAPAQTLFEHAAALGAVASGLMEGRTG
jgi:AcrR family transcriptional regulator